MELWHWPPRGGWPDPGIGTPGRRGHPPYWSSRPAAPPDFGRAPPPTLHPYGARPGPRFRASTPGTLDEADVPFAPGGSWPGRLEEGLILPLPPAPPAPGGPDRCRLSLPVLDQRHEAGLARQGQTLPGDPRPQDGLSFPRTPIRWAAVNSIRSSRYGDQDLLPPEVVPHAVGEVTLPSSVILPDRPPAPPPQEGVWTDCPTISPTRLLPRRRRVSRRLPKVWGPSKIIPTSRCSPTLLQETPARIPRPARFSSTKAPVQSGPSSRVDVGLQVRLHSSRVITTVHSPFGRRIPSTSAWR